MTQCFAKVSSVIGTDVAKSYIQPTKVILRIGGFMHKAIFLDATLTNMLGLIPKGNERGQNSIAKMPLAGVHPK